MKENMFFKKIQYFFKHNAYALSVTVCVILAIAMISFTVANYMDNQNNAYEVIDVYIPAEEDIVPTASDEPVIFELPVSDGKVIKEYAEDHLLEDKTTGYWQTHQAIDFAAQAGTKVFAVFDGTVENVEESMMDGMVITISHGGNLKSVYKCLGDKVFVEKGDKVVKGQEIGVVASNLSEKADGNHLHFELYSENKLVDPTPYFAELGK